MKPKALVLSLAALSLVFAISIADAVARLRAGAAMAASAKQFLAALGPEQRAKASFSFDDEQRLDWHFIPRPRKGLPLKELDAKQRQLAQDFLKTGLSQRGYLKATAIMDLETILREIEGGRGQNVRDPELYYFSVFGEPAAKGRWGWRVEGHHLSLNFTVVNGTMVATTPAFMGTNPAEVREGPRRGLRVLKAEEDLARDLLGSLDEAQRKAAIFEATAPKDIITMNAKQVDPLAPAGIAAGRLNARQQELLKKLIEEYIGNMPGDLAAERTEKLRRAGFEKIHFAWAGSTERNQPHYYRLQGPTFLVEYDNTQNNANHIHAAWRDFAGDFGRDLLREHYRAAPHAKP